MTSGTATLDVDLVALIRKRGVGAVRNVVPELTTIEKLKDDVVDRVIDVLCLGSSIGTCFYGMFSAL